LRLPPNIRIPLSVTFVEIFFMIKTSKFFVRLSWVTLVSIYLVIIAGSFVRITGSGMGCPDWPRCFGEWVPPTTADALPENYKDIYAEKRFKKVQRFQKMLRNVGLNKEADKMDKNMPQILVEESFNARKTWIEYINRLFGFVAGNLILLTFLIIIAKYRKRKLVVIAGINLLVLVFQAWFGSIVVATNLLPWTITIHLLLALLIVFLQLYIIRMVAPSQHSNIQVSKVYFWTILAIFLITFVQMFLGTQVREEIDFLRKSGVARENWNAALSGAFLVHRSFSWIVLGIMSWMMYKNWNNSKLRIFHWAYFILALELFSGVFLNHLNMPAMVQTLHLLLACVLFGILAMFSLRSRF
jgi:cytochrome c oxidase assembly protein subunit 15